ncbi:FHA domain-containing protein, partial [Streptomyces sp. SID10853]|uniref:FHA domain-containing protein n=1 Tax=Streptomyces sp. SID10853 TaxID=2706028 RepID=UPI001EF222E1
MGVPRGTISGAGVPELVVELNGRIWTLDPSRSYTLGRDPQGDLPIDDARVSWRHATISWGGRGWVIEDHGSTNGTFVQGQRIQQLEIGPGSSVHLGNATDGPLLSLSAGAGAAAAQVQQAPAQQAAAAQDQAPAPMQAQMQAPAPQAAQSAQAQGPAYAPP